MSDLRQSAAELSQEIRIAIIGAGFGGTQVLANLVRIAEGPLAVEWFEATEAVGEGVAYATCDVGHLLNVRADRMGAFSAQPDGFQVWLQSEEGKTAAMRICPATPIGPERFLPRSLYGAYLKAVMAETQRLAMEKGIDIRFHRAYVADAHLHEGSRQIVLIAEGAGGTKHVFVHALVLATGNLPPRRFAFSSWLMGREARYVADVWRPEPSSPFPYNVAQLAAHSEVVIIGTGLTMVDCVRTLKGNGFKGTITAISRHGLMPTAHAPAQSYAAWDWVASPDRAPATALGLFKGLRREVKRAAGLGFDWRCVVDSLRPVTPRLWSRLSLIEKRRFMEKLLTLWNIHRHRMPPEIHAELTDMRQDGSLKIVPAMVYGVESDEAGLTVGYRRRGSDQIETIRAALVLNCAGPEYDIGASGHRLLKNLRDRELVTECPTGIGIETTAAFRPKGRAAEMIFVIGALLVGELLESTAVPELREQANQVASALAERIHRLRAA